MISKIYKQSTVIFLGVLTGLIGIMWLYGFSYTQKIYPFVFVGQNNLSNLRIDEAKKVLEQSIPREIPILEIGFGNQGFVVEASELEYNPQLTAERAYLLGRDKDFINNLKSRWKLWFDKENLNFLYELNEKLIEEQVDLLISQIATPPIYSSLFITQDNQVMIVPGKSGRVVDREKLLGDIYSGLSSLNFSKIEVKVRLVEVQVSPNNLALTQKRGELLKNKTVILDYDGGRKHLSDQGLLDLVDFKGGFNKDKVGELLVLMSEEVNREPQNAVFRFKNGRVIEFKPAIDGLKLNEEESQSEIINKLFEFENLECETGVDCNKTIIKLVMDITKPEVSIEEINDLGIRELLGKGESTFHGSIPSREHNVALTAYKLNGVLVKPGEIFSFNSSVGDISMATGYQSAYIIKDGRTVLGDGGGVCQDSTTMFRAALDAGLPIIERHPHAYRVSYYEQDSPVGIDATIYSPSTDLKFMNDSPAHILIQATVNISTNYLKFEIYGTSDGRVAIISNARLWDQTPPPEPLYEDTPSLAPGMVKQIDWAAWGAKAAFDWKVVRNGEVLQEKTFYSSYRPWQAVYLRGV
ncbi:VanW family protein [Patescibacteria group bacterium]|nr:VanW family protein [Patescibacteria group bacterium]